MSGELSYAQKFGRHVRSCRRVRRLTQEVLAAKSGLATDTIRRLEHGSFSPSLDTLRKLCKGLEISLPTLFEAFEMRENSIALEVADQVAMMEPRTRVMVLRILPLLAALARGEDSEFSDEPE